MIPEVTFGGQLQVFDRCKQNQNDNLCIVFTIVLFTKYLVQHYHDQTQYACVFLLPNCIKAICEIILLDVSVQHDDRIDTYRLISVLILYR